MMFSTPTASDEKPAKARRILNASKFQSDDFIEWSKECLDILNIVLPLLENIPWAGVLAGLTRTLIETAEAVKANKRDVELLTRTASKMSLQLLAPFQEYSESELDTSMKKALERDASELISTLNDILQFCDESLKPRTRRDKIRGLIAPSKSADRIKELKERLNGAFKTFSISSDTSIRVTLAMMAKRQECKDPPIVSNTEVVTPSLPPEPYLMEGREDELTEMVDIICHNPGSNMCVLGPGGMGKTTIALAALHHQDVEQLCGQNRYFVSCEAATSTEALINVIGAALGVQPKVDFIIASLRPGDSTSAVLVLDNFETPWENGELRLDIEVLLAKLTSIPSLSVILTIRGSITPAGTKWTNTTFGQLGELSEEAACVVFTSISGRDILDPEVSALVKEVDCVPLAVTLLAEISKADAPLNRIREQWQSKKTAMLKKGKHRLSNIEVSISLSLNSQQMTEAKEAARILGVLSLLPNGLQRGHFDELFSYIDGTERLDAEITLLNLSLVRSMRGRLRILAPIRAYVTTHQFPDQSDLHRLATFYLEFLKGSSYGENIGNDRDNVAAEFSNIVSLFPLLMEKDIAGDQIIEAVAKLQFFMLASDHISLALVRSALSYSAREDRASPHFHHDGYEAMDAPSLPLTHKRLPALKIGCHELGCMQLQAQLSHNLARLHGQLSGMEIESLHENVAYCEDTIEMSRLSNNWTLCVRGIAELAVALKHIGSASDATLAERTLDEAKRIYASRVQAKDTADFESDSLAVVLQYSEARILYCAGRYTEGIALLKTSVEASRQKISSNAVSNKLDVLQCARRLYHLGDCYRMDGDNANAIEIFDEVLGILKDIGALDAYNLCLWSIAETLIDLGRFAEAITNLTEVEQLATRRGDLQLRRSCLASHSLIAFEEGRFEEAIRLDQEIRASSITEGGVQVAVSWGRTASCLWALERKSEASDAMEKAKDIYERLDLRKDAQTCEEWLEGQRAEVDHTPAHG